MDATIPIAPQPGWILLKPNEEVQRAGLLEMPDSAKSDLTRATVLRVGGAGYSQYGSVIEPAGVAEGRSVVYKKYADHSVEVDGTEYKLVHLENVMAVI